ncbi:MAG: DEAD/DEAH box helicase, partial [Acidobacteriaceae bacterium]|nr:DEAD/DEAH box helicase [Acidobacteriaceae bacterium]
EEIQAALDFWKKGTGQITAREAVRIALGAATLPGSVEFAGVSAEGWIGDLIHRLEGHTPFEETPVPEGLHAKLRPYQVRGYSWLAFVREWGLGACLADDMGLGKTIQTLALIQRDRRAGARRPVLLVCPTSVVGNWQKETARFTPELSVMVHHGVTRSRGDEFVKQASAHAMVVSSYSLLHRDFEHLKHVPWAGIVLDEAQNIKNPETKQAAAARSLNADYRIALTGTPVENNVGDLWSMMEFLNPGLLGNRAEFKRNFFMPIQSGRDPEAAVRLKKLTGPFVLRRLKTDKSIIDDLPEKQEMKVLCTLTKEQASLYAAVVKDSMDAIKSAEGIKRKGVVLATITRLKQVCNHPAQLLRDNSPLESRSGKLNRLSEMVEEAMSVGDRVLIFSQFAEMGSMLQQHLQETFGRETLFLHGGVPKKQRDQMVERFQEEKDGPPLFILSLKAGGTGLNLTRANHVFHFDRWWNPAVENQATDRAFRLGQTKHVQVHKFVCAGTFEEKIDQMIEQKKEIAANVVGTGEGWLTELSTSQLKDLFALQRAAVAE